MTNKKARWPWYALALLPFLLVPSADIYYQASWGKGCARCHELQTHYDSWQHSSHRGVNCLSCHDSSLQTNLRHVLTHTLSEPPERLKLRHQDVLAMQERCRSCHRQEYAQWQAGPHSVNYVRLFTDAKHNQQRQLMDDCFRCHGMHYPGAIQEMVQPVNTKGPWVLQIPELAQQPAIPCAGCHSTHREGSPMAKPAERVGAKQERFRPSLALYDRRGEAGISATMLPVPAMLEGGRAVRMSPDQRQALCYQCHAPLASRQVASGDDRTPIGVHEGLSCLACHQKHSQDTRASCANCHPRLSNCGLDVEKMDTTFADPKSKHNVHFVKCADCHPKGVPPPKQQRAAR